MKVYVSLFKEEKYGRKEERNGERKRMKIIYFWSTSNKRALVLVLTYSVEKKRVPEENLIFGTMPTAEECPLTAVPVPLIYCLLSHFYEAHQEHPAVVMAANQFSDAHSSQLDVQSLEVLCSRILGLLK